MVAGRYYQEVPQSSEQVDLAEYSRPPISSPTSKEVKPGSPIKPLFLAQAHPNTGYANLPMDAALDDLEKVTRQDDVCLLRASSQQETSANSHPGPQA